MGEPWCAVGEPERERGTKGMGDDDDDDDDEAAAAAAVVGEPKEDRGRDGMAIGGVARMDGADDEATTC